MLYWCFAAKKREMDDNSRRIGTLFWKLNEGQVAPHVMQKLMQLCGALDAGNWPAAAHIQVGGIATCLGPCCRVDTDSMWPGSSSFSACVVAPCMRCTVAAHMLR